MRSALPPSKRCAKSYDTLRYNVSAPGCLSLVSHDDFSATDELPADAAIITQLRRWAGERVGGWARAALPGQLQGAVAAGSVCRTQLLLSLLHSSCGVE